MATRIRLRREGRKGQSYFRIVVADSRSPRDGRFVALLGHYNPRTNPADIKVDAEQARIWLDKGALPTDTLEKGGSAGPTTRVVGRVRKPHGQQGEVAVIPLVENPGAVFTPQARLLVVNEDREVIAGPLIVARRRAYHREWLLSFVGVTSRAVVEQWRDQLVTVEEADADD